MKIKKQFDSDQFEEVIKNGVTLIDFNAWWCAPCRDQEPLIKALAKKFEHTVKVIEMDVDENRRFAVRTGITSIPTMIIFKDGKELRRFVGLQQTEVLSKAIEDALR